jgi:WD40 repeat protein
VSTHATTAAEQRSPTSPYKGLAPFEDSELDEQLFFGREHDRDVIVANVVAARLTVLYGPTGVGKSSVVRAGVARELRALTDEPLVVVCDAWAEAPAAAVAEAVANAAAIEPGPVSDMIEVAAAEHREVYLLLDQIEEYFVYHGGDGALGDVLAELVMRPELPVHILIAVREDALARLDSFKRQLPGLLANRLRLEHLSAEAGRRAILGPIERFASLAPEAEVRSIEPALVDAVLAGVSTAALVRSGRGRGSTRAGRGAARIEAPYLQVVMQRLWEAEGEAGSDVLRLSTLERLGGPGKIVGEHLERALDALGPSQKALAARIFNHLVTPSGTKIAHGTGDLAGYVEAPEAELEPVLSTLARERILRPVHGPGSEPAYEIFHDVLADAVLAWRSEFEAKAAVALERQVARRRHRRLLIFAVVALVALAAMGAATLYALSQRDQAQRNQATAQAAEQRAKTQEGRAKAFATSAQQEAAKARHAQQQAARDARRAKVQAANARTQAANAKAQARKAKLAQTLADENQRKAIAAAKLATTNAEAATLATGRETLAKQQAQRNAITARKATAKTRKALAAAGAAQRRLEKSQRQAQATATAYRSQSLLSSTPASSLTLAAEAAAIDPALPLVEFTLRRALLATRALAVLNAGDTQVRGATFSPDGALVLTAGDKGAWLFNAVSGAPAGALATQVTTYGAAFSKDGQTIAIAEKGQIELWNAQARTPRRKLFQEGSPTHVAFTPDGSLLLAWGAKSARAWNVATAGAATRQLNLPDSVTGAAIDPDGSRFVVATGAAAGIYEIPSDRLLASLPEPSVVTAARFSAAGDAIATAGADGIARLWNSADGSPRCATGLSDGALTSLVFSHDGASLLTTDVQGDTRIWSTQTCQLASGLVGQRSSVVAADFSLNDQYAVTAGSDRSARIFSLPDGTQQATLLGHDEALTSVAFSPDGTKVVTASADGKARIWDARIDRPEQPLGAHTAAAAAVAVSPDGSVVASAGADGAVRLWNLATRRALAPIDAGQPLDDVAFSQDGKLVAAAGADGTTRLWNLKTRAPVLQFTQSGAVRAISLSPDGKWLATAGNDNIARVFALHGGAAPVELTHAATVNDVAFSPDSTSLATATADGLAQIWRVATWQSVMTFTGHAAAVNSVAFSPDGTLLVTASLDHRARIWQVATGRTVRVLTGHAASVSSASFSADGRWIVTAGPRTGGIWPVVESDLDNDRLFFITDNQQRLTAATFAPTTSAPATWTIATAAANGDVATYVCALCAGTPELVHLANQRNARITGH